MVELGKKQQSSSAGTKRATSTSSLHIVLFGFMIFFFMFTLRSSMTAYNLYEDHCLGESHLGPQPAVQRNATRSPKSMGNITNIITPLATFNTAAATNSTLRYDSSDATVMAMAHGYEKKVFQRFVGSLRKTGFKGKIFIAAEPIKTMKKGVAKYLVQMNVTIMELQFMECDNPIIKNASEVKSSRDKEANTCVAPYPDVKVRWGRYPFFRDALERCKECTGPVLFTDARDTFFQRDPFGDGVPEVERFQFFAEHRSVLASHWFVARRVRICKKGFTMEGPMLCSGTTIGTREDMLRFLNIMYEEMKLWMVTPECYFNSQGGDQAIMNYLYYSDQFKDLNSHTFMARGGGIVNTVGRIAHLIDAAHWGGRKSYTEKKKGNWLNDHVDMTDEQGFFIEYDGSRSRVIHQWDRFGNFIKLWLDAKGNIYD